MEMKINDFPLRTDTNTPKPFTKRPFSLIHTLTRRATTTKIGKFHQCAFPYWFIHSSISSALSWCDVPNWILSLTFILGNELLNVISWNVLVEFQLADVEWFDYGFIIQQQQSRVPANLVGQGIQVDFILLRVLLFVVALRWVVLRKNAMRLQKVIQGIRRRYALLGCWWTWTVDSIVISCRLYRNLRFENWIQLRTDDLCLIIVMEFL